MTLGRYSCLPKTPDSIKKQVHEEIRNLVRTLEDASRSVLHAFQSAKKNLNVKDRYQIPDVFYYKNLDKKTSIRGFATPSSVGVNYWSSVHIDRDFYYTTLSSLSPDSNDKSIDFFLYFRHTELPSQCVPGR
jgi:hypothetical protein